MKTNRRSKLIVFAAAACAAAVVGYTQLSLFVYPPLEGQPDARTIVTTRVEGMAFVDSADAMCLRTLGGTSARCRSARMNYVANQSTLLLRLPYSETLYAISTGGRSDR